MKCPFRTKKVIKHTFGCDPFHVTYDKKIGTEMHTEFDECLESECPWYGKEVMESRAQGGFRKVIVPCCRRTEEGSKE